MLETKEYQDKPAAGYYALVIYDQCQPKQMPQANTLFIGQLAAGRVVDQRSGTRRQVAAPQIIDVDTTHPLMQLIDLGNVRVCRGDDR